jgi:fatty acid desaturase
MDASFERSVHLPAKKLKELKGRSDFRGWLKILAHLGAIAINSILLFSTLGSWLALPFFVLQGIFINCLYAGVHELSHNTVFKTQGVNEIFGRLFCLLLLMGRDQDKFEHFQHHRHTHNVELDAEIVGARPFTLLTYLVYFFGVSYWPGRIAEVFKLASGDTKSWPHLSAVQLKKVHKEARLMLLIYLLLLLISLVFQSTLLLSLWLFPMIVMKWFQMLQNTVEHTGMPHVDDIWLNTRTVKAGPVMQWLLWNMPYHTAHHTYPMIPFYRLPDLHRLIVAEAGEQPSTISHFGFQRQMIRKLLKDGSSKYSGRDILEY